METLIAECLLTVNGLVWLMVFVGAFLAFAYFGNKYGLFDGMRYQDH